MILIIIAVYFLFHFENRHSNLEQYVLRVRIEKSQIKYDVLKSNSKYIPYDYKFHTRSYLCSHSVRIKNVLNIIFFSLHIIP